jgi:hypothetical protein
MAATYRVTGSYEGQIDKQEYYYAYLADFQTKLAIMNGTTGPQSTEDDNAEEDTMPNSQEDNFTSPDGMDDKDEVNRTPQKSAKYHNPLLLQRLPRPFLLHPTRILPKSPSMSSWHCLLLAQQWMYLLSLTNSKLDSAEDMSVYVVMPRSPSSCLPSSNAPIHL